MPKIESPKSQAQPKITMTNTDKSNGCPTQSAAIDMLCEKKKFSVSVGEGLQLNKNRNLAQLASAIGCAAIGSFVGMFLTDDRPDLAALVGGIVGMMVGAFGSGFYLMLIRPPTIELTLSEIRNNYRRLKRISSVSVAIRAILLITLPLVIVRFGNDGSVLGWTMCLFWLSASVGLCAYTGLLSSRLRG